MQRPFLLLSHCHPRRYVCCALLFCVHGCVLSKAVAEPGTPCADSRNHRCRRITPTFTHLLTRPAPTSPRTHPPTQVLALSPAARGAIHSGEVMTFVTADAKRVQDSAPYIQAR